MIFAQTKLTISGFLIINLGFDLIAENRKAEKSQKLGAGKFIIHKKYGRKGYKAN